MMNLWKNMDDRVTASVTSADPAQLLGILNQAGIRLHRVQWKEDLTVEFACGCHDKETIRTICGKRGDSLRFSDETGIIKLGVSLIRRPVLTLGCLVFLVLTLFLPTRVLFLRVEGNQTIPSRQILEAAADCGIRFGASRKHVRSEKMKNALLGAMPSLKWAGINTSGCTAVISVRERFAQEGMPVSGETGSIVAARDAYITSVTVTRGNSLCTSGQVVKEGQVLISGYTDLGLLVQITQAQGEIFGETSREIRTITPSQTLARVEEADIAWRFSLILGKKRINFGKGSGISPATCGRIYKEYYMTLPGGFRLPVCLALDVVIPWETAPLPLAQEDVEQEMKSFSRRQVLGQTVAGRILNETVSLSGEEDRYCLEGRYLCSEMIGRFSKNEIGEINGKTD